MLLQFLFLVPVSTGIIESAIYWNQILCVRNSKLKPPITYIAQSDPSKILGRSFYFLFFAGFMQLTFKSKLIFVTIKNSFCKLDYEWLDKAKKIKKI